MWLTRWTEWSEQHVARHQVAPEEVEQVLQNQPNLSPGREQVVEDEVRGSVVAFGVTDAGRYLAVVLSPDPDGRTAFVVTARPMTNTEKRRYHWKGEQG